MSDSYPASPDDLGPLQVELRRGSRAVNIVLLAIGLGMTGGCLYLAREGGAEALVGLFFPALLLAIGWWGVRHRVRFHERGVEVFEFLGSKRMRFDEVESLSYRTVLQKVQGIPTGTYVHAHLQGGGRKLSFTLRAGKTEAGPLEDFRSRVSAAIANGSWARFQNGEAIPWGLYVLLAPDGLRYRPKGFLGRKPEQVVAYGAGLRHGFGGGFFSVFPAQGDKPLFTMSCDEPNFFPGFILFSHLTGTPAA